MEADLRASTRVRLAAPGAPEASGGITEVRHTLDRVAAALSESRTQQGRSEALQVQSALLIASSYRMLRDVESLRIELHESVVSLARQLRAEQVPPERMLVLVKDAVRDASPPLSDLGQRRELMDSVVRWSIDAYYAA